MVHCQVGSQYLLTPEKRDGRSHGQERTERYTVSSPSQPKQDEQDPHQTAEQKAQEDSHNHIPAQHRPHKKCHLHIPHPDEPRVTGRMKHTAVNASTAGYLALIGWWHSAHLPLTISQPSNGRL